MKYLIKDNQIVRSGIPDIYTRDNGQVFYGGYKGMTDIHYEDGWRDEVMPDYDPLVKTLGERYYDATLDKVTWTLVDRVIDLAAEKARIMDDLVALRKEIGLIITDIRLLYDPEPQALTDLTPQIRGLYAFAKDEINALTVDNVLQYVLRGPQVQGLIDTLNGML